MKTLGIDGPAELARRAGVSQPGLLPLRQGVRKKYQPRLTRPVCDALGWTRDSIERLLAGKPAILAVEADDSTVYATAADLAVLHARLEEIASQAMEAKKLADAASTGIRELLLVSNAEKKAGKAQPRGRRGTLGNVGS